MKRIVVCGVLLVSLLGPTRIAIASPTVVTPLTHVSQLQAELNRNSRLYIVGEPDSVGEYRKVVDANPELVFVVIEESSTPEVDVQAVMNTLNNFDIVRTQMVNDFLGEPEAFIAVRIDTDLSKRRPDGSRPGFTGVTVTEAQRSIGVADEDLWAIYQDQRNSGLSVPNSIARAIGEVRSLVAQSIKDRISNVSSRADEVLADINALNTKVETTGYSPESYSWQRIGDWKNRLALASQEIDSLAGVATSNIIVEGVAQEVGKVSKDIDRFVELEVSVGEMHVGIAALERAVGVANYQPEGFSSTKLIEWNDSLNSVLELLQQGSFSQAQNTFDRVDSEVAQMLGEVQEVVSIRAAYRNSAIAAFLLSSMALSVSVVVTRRVRKGAESLAQEIRQEVGYITSQAIDLADNSAYVAIGAQGMQKEESEKLEVLTGTLLEQTAVLSKYLTRCDKVLDAKGFAALVHLLTPFGVMYVKAISTGKKAITLSPDDVKSLTGHSGDKLQSFAAQLNFVSRDVRVTEVRKTYSATFEKAEELCELLKESESKLAKDIVDIETGLRSFQENLKEIGSPELFNCSAYQVGIIEPIGNPQGGLIAIARQKQSENDHLGGLRHGIEPAMRILIDGQKAFELTIYGVNVLVRQCESVVESLKNTGVQSGWSWIFTETATLSDELDDIIRSNSFVGSISKELVSHRQKLEGMVEKLLVAERLNGLRVEEWAEDLEERKMLVVSSGTAILVGLKKLGFYENGEAEGLYREEGESPKGLINQFDRALHRVDELLAIGQVQEALLIEKSIISCNTEINSLVEKTEKRLAEYPASVFQIDTNIETGECLVKDVINSEVSESHFSDRSQQMAISKTGSPVATLLETFSSARQKIGEGINGRQRADLLMNSASILAAGEVLDEARSSIDAGNALLLAISKASKLLDRAVVSAELEINTAIKRYKEAVIRLDEMGVRKVTRGRADRIMESLGNLRSTYHNKPYEALEALSSFSEAADELEKEILFDIQTFALIMSTIGSAESEENSAVTAIKSAEKNTFQYATVDTSSAIDSLNSFRSGLVNARRYLNEEDYESALREAELAYNSVTCVSSLAVSAVDSAARDNRNEVDRLDRIAQEEAAQLEAARSASIDIDYSGGYDSSFDTDWSGGSD